MPQCKGTTKQNLRCKITVADGHYCRYHKSQAGLVGSISGVISEVVGDKPSTTHKPSTTNTANHSGKPPVYKIRLENSGEPVPAFADSLGAGSIYVYTLSHLLDKHPSSKDWLQIQKPGTTKYVPFDPKDTILLKIGLTTQIVAKRMGQWVNQCNHEITLIEPMVLSGHTPSVLKTLFSGLTISEKSTKSAVKDALYTLGTKDRLKEQKLKTFNDFDNGFYCKKNLPLVEKKIHAVLRAKYGRVEVQCENCTLANKKSKSAIIHREWFIIPRSRMIDVFYLVDSICYKEGT